MKTESSQHWSASLALRVTVYVGIATTTAFLLFAWLVERSIDQHFVEQDFGEIEAVVSALQLALESAEVVSNSQYLHEQLAAAGVGHHGVELSPKLAMEPKTMAFCARAHGRHRDAALAR